MPHYFTNDNTTGREYETRFTFLSRDFRFTTSDGVFSKTFYNMRSLTGPAQTFINNKLGGLDPADGAETFTGTAVTDLASLHSNWK